MNIIDVPKLPLTLGLLQGWLDIGAMVILSLLCFIWAGQTLLGFCLLTCTFILSRPEIGLHKKVNLWTLKNKRFMNT
jgi:hypothetical protein